MKRDPNSFFLTRADRQFLLSVGIACRFSYRDQQHDEIVAEHHSKMAALRRDWRAQKPNAPLPDIAEIEGLREQVFFNLKFGI